MATNQFRNLREVNSYDYENRIIILSDAQPNSGDFSAGGLVNMLQNNANSRIYTTFIGIGVDFNTDLTDQITKVKGANYYSVHSPREFRQRVDEEFDYMVTPLIFNLQMNLQSQSWKIDQVFGSPEADQATGQLMKINTLFPSKSEGGAVKGGIVLLKLRKISNQSSPIRLSVTYEDRNGRTDGSEQVVYPGRNSAGVLQQQRHSEGRPPDPLCGADAGLDDRPAPAHAVQRAVEPLHQPG